jgi:hypothetical protein
MEASTLFAIFIASCSEDISRLASKLSGEKISDVMYLYITSPKLALAFCKKDWINKFTIMSCIMHGHYGRNIQIISKDN